MCLQLAPQRVEVKEAILVLGNAHDLRADLAPRQQIRVVLARAHEYHWGCGQLQAVYQFVHGPRAAMAGKDDSVVLRGVDCVAEYVSCLMSVLIKLDAENASMRYLQRKWDLQLVVKRLQL